MQISTKIFLDFLLLQKLFLVQNQKFFIASMKSTLNSEYFEKKDQSHTLSITEIFYCETGSYWNV